MTLYYAKIKSSKSESAHIFWIVWLSNGKSGCLCLQNSVLISESQRHIPKSSNDRPSFQCCQKRPLFTSYILDCIFAQIGTCLERGGQSPLWGAISIERLCSTTGSSSSSPKENHSFRFSLPIHSQTGVPTKQTHHKIWSCLFDVWNENKQKLLKCAPLIKRH